MISVGVRKKSPNIVIWQTILAPYYLMGVRVSGLVLGRQVEAHEQHLEVAQAVLPHHLGQEGQGENRVGAIQPCEGLRPGGSSRSPCPPGSLH